jgi:hypothetical protein
MRGFDEVYSLGVAYPNVLHHRLYGEELAGFQA